jgi:hypothetical protein
VGSERARHSTGAEFTQVPKGLKIIEYRAVNANETDGNILFSRNDGKSDLADLIKTRNYAGHPVKVKAKSGSDTLGVVDGRVPAPHGRTSSASPGRKMHWHPASALT